jgi:signal transduction histidine kinase
LKTNLLSFFRSLTNFGEKDVFKSTQGRLTRIYSGLLILFLILFIMIVYSVLYFSILRNQETELETLVTQEASFLEDYLTTNEKSDFRGIQNQEVVFAGVNQLFYYVVNSNGELIMGNEADQRMRSAVLDILNVRGMNDGEILKETLHLDGNERGRGKSGEFFQRGEPERNIRLIIASQSIYDKGRFVGKLFIGKDITFAYQLFHWLLIILLVIGIVFVGVALLISTAMSKKAMIPISRAFTRQREFVADASHELRTPLSVLLSSLDAIDMTLDTKKEEFAGKLLFNMRQEVKRMTGLVSDLLTLARSDSNIIERRTETFDFLPHAEKAIESVQPLAESKQIRLHLEAPDSLIAKGDSQRLSQLLYILLDNAIKYTPNDGEVWLYLLMEGNELCILVRDTGIGIKKEDQIHIFERFYRVDKSRSRQMGGHGLGLSIAKWIVETHNGTINIASEVGKGTIFTIRIPLNH